MIEVHSEFFEVMAHVISNDFRECSYDRTIVVVRRIRILYPFIVYTWIEYLLFTHIHKFPDVTVNYLGRITGCIRAYIFHTLLIYILGGHRTQHHAVLEFREESMPERIILKDIKDSGYGHVTSYRLFL